MIRAILSGLFFGVSIIILKFFVNLSLPGIFLDLFFYLGGFFGLVGFLLFQMNLKKMSSGVTNMIVTSIATIIPVASAVLIFQEALTIQEIIGIIIIALSIFLLFISLRGVKKLT